MKIIAIVLIVAGLVLIFVPSFYTCAAQGKAIQLPSGKSIPMKCLWTARAEIGLGILLVAVAAFLFISRKLESRRFLSILTLILGILIVLFPTSLIGVCVNPDMPCVVVMKPTLLLIGIVTIALGIVATAWNLIRKPQSE
jgi:cellulose synthase/poly-beta-1,6-N-acetylglucosamine synthase-like glycosyltransferase